MSLAIDDEVSNAWNRLTSDTCPISWIMCGYPEGSSNKLQFVSEGEGGMPEFISNLPSNDIVWGAFKVVGVDDRGNTISRRPKFIFVKYLPVEGVSTMKRARAGGHKGAIKQVIDAHIDFEIESPDELTEELIIQKLRASGGAHAPTSYEFSNYSS
mmetsp:Transcript_3549/g.5529  ORF Transcript_3549/g.5529 Transcript_3549/m.5529 type:complete len:156 (-) Transcript_3549:159-626(-)|eukprot:CAMPEP_0185024620 /NCGR_PEP_ID=MMETSP1103-20130426/7769_1 /TAXON_ID=36769 /ORGANISM="Paraphysomonas bandaiensis, Strain Caron Lab Isolate" /LENGTH=155 /DNA_ID=CAMNT_0027557637 /DNA_START=75 /DNA_END=542 /DNA_ORIENTATION=+